MVLILMALVAAVGIAGLVLIARQIMIGRAWRPGIEVLGLGAVTNFFDTLGIGSFAPTMAWFRFRRLVDDRAIPPTMYIGHALPSIVQALIFLAILGAEVSPWLLVGCVLAMLIGVTLGVRLVAHVSIRALRAGIATALVIAAAFYAATNLGVLPGGGAVTALPPALMLVAVLGYLVMGVAVNFGIGHYAPSLVMFSLMGMDPRLVFPIMATAGVLGMSRMGLHYLTDRAIDLRVVLGLTLGGLPAVLIAAFVVRAMPLVMLRWLVVAVVVYAAIILFHAALTDRQDPVPAPDLP